MTREEAEYLIDNDREKVIEILMHYPVLVQQVQQLVSLIDTLQERVRQLEAQLGQNSQNSSRPPSSDGFKKKPKSTRNPSPEKKGGQKNHEGDTLKQVAQPDETVPCAPSESICSCGCHLENVPGKIRDRRQVFDIPEPKVKVTEYQRLEKVCPNCQQTYLGTYPDEANAPVQYGNNVKTIMVYLNTAQLIPLNRVGQLLYDLYGLPKVADDTIQSAISQAYHLLSPFWDQLQQVLIRSSLLYADETGMSVQKARNWLHVLSNGQFTAFYPHPSRGKKAHQAIGILPDYKGILVSDRYYSYKGYEFLQALCHAHLNRDLKGIIENDPAAAPWAQNMLDWSLNASKIIETYQEKESQVPQDIILTLEEQYYQILLEGSHSIKPNPKKAGVKGKAKQSKAFNLLKTYIQDSQACLRFLHDPQVPYTNNLAERSIRMMKLREKISGCFRSEKGPDIFCRIRSFISTIKAHHINAFEALSKIWQGNPEKLLDFS